MKPLIRAPLPSEIGILGYCGICKTAKPLGPGSVVIVKKGRAIGEDRMITILGLPCCPGVRLRLYPVDEASQQMIRLLLTDGTVKELD